MEDADAFSLLYEREGERVLLFLARRTLDVEVPVKLTAETFAIALTSWRRLSELHPEQARAWLFTVARRLHGRYLRSARVERRALQRLGIRTPAVHEDDVALIEEKARLADVRAVLRQELSDGGAGALERRARWRGAGEVDVPAAPHDRPRHPQQRWGGIGRGF